MDLRIFLAILLSILPVSELRAGMPLAIIYARDHAIPLLLIVPLIIMVNILVIFLIFYFLDNLHHLCMNNRTYEKFFGSYMKKLQKKVDKFEKRYSVAGFLALTLFVAIPFLGTGVWTGSIISWILDLDRKKSVFSIALGVILAGILVLLGTLGFLNAFS